MRLLTRHEPAYLTGLGLDVVAAGVAFGLVVLVVFVIARIRTAGKSRPPVGTADHRRGTAGPQPAASHGHGKSSGRGTSQGHRQDRLRAGAPAAGSGHGGRDGGARSSRPPVLKPTNVYTPGGLLDVPRDGRAPGTAGGQAIPEILRTAGPPPPGVPGAPGSPPGGRSQDRPSPGWSGGQPRPGYQQPGMNPGGPGRAPYIPGGQPAPPMPPRDHMRPREAPRPGQAMPPREGMPAREPMPPRGAAPAQKPQAAREVPRPGHAGPPRDAGLPRDGMPRESMGPGGPIRSGGPPPPRDPAHQPPPSQGQHRHQGGSAGRHAGGPGYGAPGGRRPGVQGHAAPPGPPGPAEASGQFDGGYAYVIRPSDNPARSANPTRPPTFGRAADPARPAEPAEASRAGQASRAGCVRLPGHQWPAR